MPGTITLLAICAVTRVGPAVGAGFDADVNPEGVAITCTQAITNRIDMFAVAGFPTGQGLPPGSHLHDRRTQPVARHYGW